MLPKLITIACRIPANQFDHKNRVLRVCLHFRRIHSFNSAAVAIRSGVGGYIADYPGVHWVTLNHT